jgi:hypothetical protein
MTSTTSDQIEEIKTAEQKAKKMIEEKQKELLKQQEIFKNLLTEKKDNHLNQVKKQGLTQLEKATADAERIKKDKETDTEGTINSLISKAKSKENEAYSLIEASFLNQIK